MPVFFLQPTIILVLDSVMQGLMSDSPYGYFYVRHHHAILFAVKHTYNMPCCPLVTGPFLCSTVIRQGCVDLCRACGSLNRSTTSGVIPARIALANDILPAYLMIVVVRILKRDDRNRSDISSQNFQCIDLLLW